MLLPLNNELEAALRKYEWLRPATELEILNYRAIRAECEPYVAQVINRLRKEALDA